MQQDHNSGDSLDVGGVLTYEEYVERLRRRAERGRDSAGVPLLSEDEAFVIAELLGEYVKVHPTAELNRLAAEMASRLYGRLGI